MTSLRTRDIVALGFMTFALFIGAGNIIFPPIVAQQAGEHVWLAALGFLITAVGLPVITQKNENAKAKVEAIIQRLAILGTAQDHHAQEIQQLAHPTEATEEASP